MARTVIIGFDSGDNSIEGITQGAAGAFDATTPDGVGQSMKYVATSGAAGNGTHTVASPQWRRARFRFTALPATTRRIFVGDASFASLRINPAGTVAYYAGASAIGTSATALTDTARWYTVEWLSHASSSSLVRLRIDGVDEVTTTDTTTFAGKFGPSDTVADTYTMYVDDYVADGAAFPGSGAVRLLLPISDSARGAQWFAGNAQTTSLFEAVNNTPPVGTVQPNAVTAAITHAGSGANPEDYDANMTSYSTAGIAAGSTINAIQAVCAHAEDIATGAKLLTMSVKSNPAQGAFETNWTAGNASAAGTYPTNWVIQRGTVISGPSVTLGTSPVMTMRRPETASRRADVCFMGIYVDYTPAVAAAFLAPRATMVRQAVKRAGYY